jgi:polysaccharide export outer membrane protein
MRHALLFILIAAILLAPGAYAQVTSPQTSASQPQIRTGPFSDNIGANLPAQRIGPNDLLSISVYDAPEFTRTVRVSADGMVMLPLMKKPVQAAGLLPSELEPRLAQALRDQDLLNEATVIVIIEEYNSRPITVTGSVRSPLTFQAIGRVRLMDAITRAGGIAPEAGPEVDVVTPDGAVRKIALKPLLDSATPDLNIDLQGGEEVRVPGAGRVYVLGNVKTAGAFPITDQADSSVLKFITLAGGLNSVAPKEAYIIRIDPATQVRHEISIPMKDIVDRKSPDPPLEAHDVLYIPENKKHEAMLSVEKILAIAAGGAIIANVAK